MSPPVSSAVPAPRRTTPPARPRLAVAPGTARRRLRARIVVWGTALVTVLSLFTLVAFHALAAQSAFTLERLANERTNERLRYERLREETARQSSPDVVIKAALALGLVMAPKVTPINAPAAAPSRTPASSLPDPLKDPYNTVKQSLDGSP